VVKIFFTTKDSKVFTKEHKVNIPFIRVYRLLKIKNNFVMIFQKGKLKTKIK